MDDTPLRTIPSVDRVLRTPPVLALLESCTRDVVVRLARSVIDDFRAALKGGAGPPSLLSIAREVQRRGCELLDVGPVRVINATGVLLHTNLARAPLSDSALEAMKRAAGYSDLELNLSTGQRGDRQTRAQRQLQLATGAEAAHITVNAAAAVLLALTAVAKRKEVLVSRGQSVEIGGGFRVPIILQQSGARLVEVGTTNRTRVEDYESGLTSRTAAILHVHSSNFRITGFTESVPLARLTSLARQAGVPLIDDNGSGALLDTTLYGLAHEPTVQESVIAGSNLVAFSGDKLLGGPQAGIVVGNAEWVARLARHPLARALRPDKLTLAGLSATLVPYLQGRAVVDLPLWQMLSQSGEKLQERARSLRERLASLGVDATLQPGASTIGGGSLPGETLPTTLIVLPRDISTAALREGDPPVICLTRDGKSNLDLRTVPPVEESTLVQAVARARHARRESEVG